MPFLSKYGVARHIYIPMVKRAVVDHAVSADWTPAAGDVKISKDGGAAANVTNLPAAIAMGNSTIWDFSLTATETQAAQVMVTIGDTATKAVEDSAFIIETYGNASGQHAVDLADSVRAGLTALPNAAAGANGGLPTGNASGQVVMSATATGAIVAASFAAGAIDASAIAADAIGSSELAATAVAEIAAGVWGDTVAGDFTVAASVGKSLMNGVALGTGLTINAYTGNTVQTGDAYARLAAPAGASVSADIAAVKALLPTALVGGRMDSSVGAVAANSITAAAIADGAIDRATFAADTGLACIRSNTAQAGGATTITLDASASASNNFYNNCIVYITGGTGIGQSRFITAYVGATKVATVAAWVTNPDNTSVFVIWPFDAIAGASAPTAAQVATAVWQDTVAGDFTTALSVGKSLMNGVSLGTGLTVAAVSGAVGSVTGAVASVTGNVGGNVTGSVGSVTGLTAATVHSDLDDIQARLPAALTAGGNMKSDVLALNGSTTGAANIAKTTAAIARGTCDGSATTTSLSTSAFTPSGAAADQFKGRIVTFDADTTTTALRGQATDITASSNAATPTLTVTALTTAPASGDTFSVT